MPMLLLEAVSSVRALIDGDLPGAWPRTWNSAGVPSGADRRRRPVLRAPAVRRVKPAVCEPEPVHGADLSEAEAVPACHLPRIADVGLAGERRLVQRPARGAPAPPAAGAPRAGQVAGRTRLGAAAHQPAVRSPRTTAARLRARQPLWHAATGGIAEDRALRRRRPSLARRPERTRLADLPQTRHLGAHGAGRRARALTDAVTMLGFASHTHGRLPSCTPRPRAMGTLTQ